MSVVAHVISRKHLLLPEELEGILKLVDSVVDNYEQAFLSHGLSFRHATLTPHACHAAKASPLTGPLVFEKFLPLFTREGEFAQLEACRTVLQKILQVCSFDH